MKSWSIIFLMFLYGGTAMAQNRSDEGNTRQTAQEQRAEQMKNNMVMKMARAPLKNTGDARVARNILILQEVINFKLGDERLQKEFAAIENNSNYYKKLEKIMKELDNRKNRNSINNQVINILDDAGNKIYNLLAD